MDAVVKETKKSVVAMRTNNNKSGLVAMETYKELHEIDVLLGEVYTGEELEEIYSPRSVENLRTSFELRNSREDTDDLLRQVFKVKDVSVRSYRVTLAEITACSSYWIRCRHFSRLYILRVISSQCVDCSPLDNMKIVITCGFQASAFY